MKWLAILFAFLLVAPAMGQPKAAPLTPMTPTPDDRARQWLVLVDDQNYADAYNQMGLAARNRIAAAPWMQKLRDVREPLGALSSRALKDVKLTKTLPAMRDGQYAIVRYDSAFAHKAMAVESLTLVSENGEWSVIGYFID
jgi:hypothetical protein